MNGENSRLDLEKIKPLYYPVPTTDTKPPDFFLTLEKAKFHVRQLIEEVERLRKESEERKR